MPRCPLCGSAHIVVTFRPERRAYCFGCDLQWGLDADADIDPSTTSDLDPTGTQPAELHRDDRGALSTRTGGDRPTQGEGDGR